MPIAVEVSHVLAGLQFYSMVIRPPLSTLRLLPGFGFATRVLPLLSILLKHKVEKTFCNATMLVWPGIDAAASRKQLSALLDASQMPIGSKS